MKIDEHVPVPYPLAPSFASTLSSSLIHPTDQGSWLDGRVRWSARGDFTDCSTMGPEPRRIIARRMVTL